MKVLSLTDTHAYASGEFSHPVGTTSTLRLQQQMKTFQWVAKEIRDRKPDVVVHHGDFFENPDSVDARTLDAAVGMWAYIKSAAREVDANLCVIPGNHDKENDDLHLLSWMHDFPSCSVYNNLTFLGETIAFVPYMRDRKVLLNIVQEAASEKVPYLYTHNDIIGAMMNPGKDVEHGLDPDTDLAPFRRVVSGHLHYPQEFKNILMLGSTMYHDYRDRLIGEHRGIVIFDTDTNTFERVPNPVCPYFVTVTIEQEDDVSKVFEHWDLCDPARTYLRVLAGEVDRVRLDKYLIPFLGSRVTDIPTTRGSILHDVNLETAPVDAWTRSVQQYPPSEEVMTTEEAIQLGIETVREFS